MHLSSRARYRVRRIRIRCTKLSIPSTLVGPATCLKLPTNEFKHEWFDSSRDLWGIRSGDHVEMYVAWVADQM